ncbi:MAG: peptide-methionine (S)-S-oxide reductase MsrA [Gammaproteobacteria bacterium]|nr:peptide-methionine (S)-S-oxide reductase MsrA [Gammaproteobacteria bacterium]
MSANAELATLGGGCFWCMEPLFAALKAVSKVESGYSGGKIKNSAYREVCAGTTGHAEVVQVTFDPDVISYQELLEIFFTLHDPTTLNRQGNDAGTQYRSVIFYHSPAQKETAECVIKEVTASGDWLAPIVTEVTPFSAFYRAEDYHQDYYARNGNQPYCQLVISPKLKKFRERYKAKLNA